jgi:hypothetical protein
MYFTGINPTICFGFQQAIIRLCVRKQKDKTLQMKEGRFHPCYRPRRPLGRVQVYLYSVFYLGTRMGWGVSVTPRPLSTPGKNPVPILQAAGWAPGPFWTGTENLAPTGIRSPDRRAPSQSLYRLSYRALTDGGAYIYFAADTHISTVFLNLIIALGTVWVECPLWMISIRHLLTYLVKTRLRNRFFMHASYDAVRVRWDHIWDGLLNLLDVDGVGLKVIYIFSV